jgi:cell division protein FtsZ
VQQGSSSAAAKSKPQADHDYLDIPAFLRKQAD